MNRVHLFSPIRLRELADAVMLWMEVDDNMGIWKREII